MRKLFNIFAITIISAIIAGIYGIFHDQITYTISPEYYTKFKFIQFGLREDGVAITAPRLYVAVVGWMATWWVGLFIGFILSLFTLNLKHDVYKTALKAIGVVLAVAFVTGLAGLLIGSTLTEESLTALNWYFPENLIDKRHFVMVGYMHTYGYVGGLIGLIAGIIYIWRCKKSVIKK
ncbi:MAG: hypothetical protein ACO1N9_04205 [Flavobacterium sp.]